MGACSPAVLLKRKSDMSLISKLKPSCSRYYETSEEKCGGWIVKMIQNQSLTKSVLNSRSPELWRQTGGERESGASAASPQCGGFWAKAVVIGDLSGSKAGGEIQSR